MKTITGNHIKFDDGRLPIPKSSKLLRAMLTNLVIDIASKLEHTPHETHEFLILEWRVLGMTRGESMAEPT